jgi:GNAT superfamily N-acetyltransferase
VLAVGSAPLSTPAIEARVAAAGIRTSTLRALQSERGDEVLEAASDLHAACRLDQPTLGRVTAQPFADWRAYHVTDAVALPEAYFIALDRIRLVGASAVRREGDDSLRIGVTGVLPAYRRRGIGRLLKLRVHAWARANGFREIHTSTTTPNVGMLALNDALGCAIVGSWGGYERRLGR